MSLSFDALKKACRPGAARLTNVGSPVNPIVESPAPKVHSLPKREERRSQSRAKVNVDVRLRPAHSKGGDFKEILSTKNVSRGGFYFITPFRHYRIKMWLRVAFPYSSEHDIATMEENAEVMRVEDLSNSRVGVAIALRGSSVPAFPGGALRIPSGFHNERRRRERHWLTTSALVIDCGSKTKLEARCSDLSLIGCYVDTLNPFPEGTAVQIRLSKEYEVFESSANTVTSSPGMGMGMEFGEFSPELMALLTTWLPIEK